MSADCLSAAALHAEWHCTPKAWQLLAATLLLQCVIAGALPFCKLNGIAHQNLGSCNLLLQCVTAAADQQDVRQRMNLRWGVMPFRLDFAANPEENVDTTFQ